jgi:uncharacterized protein
MMNGGLNTMKAAWLVSLCTACMTFPVYGADRTISVNGQGEVRAEPDRAVVSLGLESRKPTLQEARAEVDKGVNAVLKLTRDLKIDPKQVRTTRVQVQPEYDWNNEGRDRRLIGYFVARQVEVELRQLDQLGTLLERAFTAGVNQVGDPQLDSSRRRDLQREALAKAVSDARSNAESLAKAAGVKVGSPRTISASSGVVAPPVPMRAKVMSAAMEASDGSAQSYKSGEMAFNATVQVDYELVAEGAAP